MLFPLETTTAASQETVGGVAYGAHVGGFVAGIALAMVLRGVISRPDSMRKGRRGRR